MLYRIKADLSFADEATAQEVYQYLKFQSAQSVVINPGKPNKESGILVLEHCGHDENKPCQILEPSNVEQLR